MTSQELTSRFMRMKFVKLVRYSLYNFSLPGNKGVPIYDIVAYLLRGIGNGDLWRASKGLAFSFLMALPPLLIFAFTLIAFLPFDGLQDQLLLQLQDIVPPKILDPLAATINDVMGHKHTSLLSIGFVLSIILAANAMHGMMMYLSDRGMERRKFIIRYPLCILLVFMLYTMLVLMLICLIGYKNILLWMFRQGWLIPGPFTHLVIGAGGWIITSAMGLLILSTIYYLVPSGKHRVGFFSSGAIFALGMFMLLSWGFRIYLAHFNQYNLLYGSIGTLLVIMLWIFLNCLVVMLGYELNMAIVTGNLKSTKRVNHRLSHFRKNLPEQDLQTDNNTLI